MSREINLVLPNGDSLVRKRQYVYVLRCIRFYGQIEGIFLTLEEIEHYLKEHPNQPTPPPTMFNDKDYWERYDPTNHVYWNDYFKVAWVEYMGVLCESQTRRSNGHGFVLLWQYGNILAASGSRVALRRIGLKKVFAECNGYNGHNRTYFHTNVEWLRGVIGRVIPEFDTNDLTDDEIDTVWDERIDGDTWSQAYIVLDIE